MPGETPSQPGWYPDQNGTMRWFDGVSWTDHVQPGTGSAGAEATMVTPSGPSPTRPIAQQPGWQQGQPPAGPPSGPPQGAPGSAYGAVPQPSFPGGPGPGGPGGPGPGFPPPPSSGGGNKGLLIILAVVGAIVLIAILAVGSWAVFLRDDDSGSDSGNDNGGDDSSLPDTAPDEVAEQFMEGVRANDCEVLEELVTERLLEEEGGCQVEEMPTEFTYVVGEPAVDEDAQTASVPVELTIAEGIDPSTIELAMVVEDEEWKIDDIGDPEEPTDGSTDPSTASTDGPTDPSTDFSDLTDYTDLTDFSDLPDLPTDPSELESYFSEYFSDFLTATP